MRSVKYILAAGAASMMSTAALAADMPSIMPPPPYYAPQPIGEDFGGWYLRGDIGFSNQSVKTVKNTNAALYAPLTSFDQTTGFDTGGTYQIGVGYQFNNWFRADVTGQYRGNANFHGLDIVSYPNGGSTGYGSDIYRASKSEWLFLANVYADLGTWWCVTPYIGAGLGYSRVNISNFTDQGVATLFPPGNGVGPSTAYASTASKWNVAWALHAGLAYKVNPGLTVELGYSYANLGDGVTGPVTTFTGFTTNNVMSFKDITSHDVKLGVRWSLDAGPGFAPLPPPPLIRKG